MLEPALILSGTWWETIFAAAKVGVGIILIAGSLQSYLFGIGHVDKGGARGILGRMFMGIGGGVIALPASSMLGISLGPLELVILGLLVSILGVFSVIMRISLTLHLPPLLQEIFRLSQSKLRRARSCCSLNIWMYVSRG